MALDVRRSARRGGRTAATLILLAAAWVAGAARPARAVVFGQLDDFQSGTVGWSEGFSSPNPPTTVADGGPQGAGDAYLRDVAGGGFGAGSRQVMFNQAQWAGDYNAAGVTRVTGWAANFGTSPLHLRLALDASFNRFSSTTAIDLPADGAWYRVNFDLTPQAMTRVQGSIELSQALASVTEVRLLSNTSGPSFNGEAVASTMAFDDLRAMRPEGDANFDGSVDAADLSVVRSNLGTASGATWAAGDFDFDGRVNAKDLALLRRNLQTSAPAAISLVPEPTCGALGAAGALLLRRTRRAAHAR
jgi:hypothetical protein